jgi:hypothetical protein
MKLRPTWIVLSVALLSLSSASAQIDEKNWGKNTAGVSLATHEEPRQKTAQGTIIWYNLIGKGFPDGVPLTLWQWIPGQQPKAAMDGVSFDKRGVLVCSGNPGFCQGDGPDDPINLKTTAILGEPKRFGVASGDGSLAAFVDAVPFPIEATDKGCTLSVVRMSPLAEFVVARATGFSPGEKLAVVTHSGPEGATLNEAADGSGNWTTAIGTQVKGQSRGKASLSLTGKSCTVSVSFDWGTGSNHPL